MKKILILAKKELVETFRETSGFLYLFFMPAALLIAFNLTLGGAYSVGSSKDNPIRVTVVNLDQGAKGQELVQALDDMTWIRTETTDSDGNVLTEEVIRDAVANGRRSSAVVIPADYSEKINTGEKPEITLLVDPTVPIQFVGPIEGALTGALFSSLFSGDPAEFMPSMINKGMDAWEEKNNAKIPPSVREMFTDPESIKSLFPAGGEGGLLSEENMVATVKQEVVQPAKKEEEVKYPTIYQQNLSGYSVMAVFFLILSLGSALLTEKGLGTFTRILAAPMDKATYLAGKMLPYVLIALMQIALLNILSMIFYNTNMGSDIIAIVIITICTAIASAGLGLVLVSLFPGRGKFEGVSTVVVLILTAFSGSFVPRFVLGEFVQQASLFIPQSWALIAYQDIMVRQKTIIDILPHCGILLGFATLFFLIGIWRFKFQEK